MNKKQVQLLKRLEKTNRLKFSQLFRGFDPEDKIPYHISQLIKNNLVYKADGLYHITPLGMQLSLNFDSITFEKLRVQNVLISLVCKIGEKYIIRSKESNGDMYYYFPRTKALFSETAQESCLRLLRAEISELPESFLHFTYMCTHSKHQSSSSGELILDNVNLYFHIELPNNIAVIKEGDLLFSRSELRNMTNIWPEIELLLLNDQYSPFSEYSFVCDYNIS